VTRAAGGAASTALIQSSRFVPQHPAAVGRSGSGEDQQRERDRQKTGGVLLLDGRCRIRTGDGIIGALAWTRAVIVSAGAAACLVGCITGAAIPPTYTQDELKATCERNGFRWYPDDLTGGFCERR